MSVFHKSSEKVASGEERAMLASVLEPRRKTEGDGVTGPATAAVG